MKANALALSLILILVPLAGCAGSDGEVNVDLTTEEIQELIDDNIDDFLNNTTVTVNQENHNNNTTNSQSVVNHYNYTIIEQPSSLKSKSGTLQSAETSENFPIGPYLIIRGDRYDSSASENSISGLNGANICVGIGTEMESYLWSAFDSMNIDYTAVPIGDAAEATQKFRDGECDAMIVDSFAIAEQKMEQLENDSTWTDSPNEGIWMAAVWEGESNAPGIVGNSASFTIEQGSDEMIVGIVYFHLHVDLIGTCTANSTDCTNFTVSYSLTDDTDEFRFQGDNDLYMNSTCSYGTTFSQSQRAGDNPWYDGDREDRPWGYFPGQGLNCTHTLSFQLSVHTSQISWFDSESHELSWSDWVFSAVWESRPIEQVN